MTLLAIVVLSLFKDGFEISSTEILAFVGTYMGLHTASDVGGQWVHARYNGLATNDGMASKDTEEKDERAEA